MPATPHQRDPEQDSSAPAQLPHDPSQLVPPSLQQYPDTLVPQEFEAPSDEPVPVAAGVGVAAAASTVAASTVAAPVAHNRRATDAEPTWSDGESLLPPATQTEPPAKSLGRPTVSPGDGFPRRTLVRLSAIAFGVLLAVLLAIGGLWVATGGRYYIMTTPSMSPALPVGSLVLTKPYKAAEVTKGTIIAFAPPIGPYRTYTHRVIDVQPDGYLTKGDAVMHPDNWGVVPFANVHGIVVAVLPGVGWLVRALPWLLLGLLIAIGLAAFVPWRWGVFMPIVAMVIVLTVPLLVLKPLVRGELVETAQDQTKVTARVVNTGLLPLKFAASGIEPVHVAPGHWTDLHLPVPKETGKYGIKATVDLGLTGWIILGLLCLLPLFIGLTIALREWRKERTGALVLPT